MGYFKRKLDRGRSRELVRRLRLDASWDPEPETPWESVAVGGPPGQRRFLRFACAEIDCVSGRRTGIFTAVYELLRDAELDAVSRASLRQTLDWFEEHLPAPKHFHDDAAVFLFKSLAGECTSRIWELVRQLAEHGIRCEQQVFSDPGLIVYEDAYQVAVVPRSGPSAL